MDGYKIIRRSDSPRSASPQMSADEFVMAVLKHGPLTQSDYSALPGPLRAQVYKLLLATWETGTPPDQCGQNKDVLLATAASRLEDLERTKEFAQALVAASRSQG